MRKLAFAGVAACAVAISAQMAAAQTGTCSINSTGPTPLSCAVTSTHSLTIPSLLTLNMSGFTGPGSAMTLNAPTTMADYTSSTIQMPTTGPTFTVSANRNWKVQISAATAAFAGPYAKPAGDLLWSNVNGSGYAALTTTPVDMTSGTATTLSTATGVFYKTTYNIATDVPGSYSLDVKFTLVAP
jgi:hypothetical protein